MSVQNKEIVSNAHFKNLPGSDFLQLFQKASQGVGMDDVKAM